MADLNFSEEEILEQLSVLGYRNIAPHRLREFKRDLDQLIEQGEWKSRTDAVRARQSPPAFTIEKVSQHQFKNSGDGFFLHLPKPDHEHQLHHQTRDSYAQHSVAPKLQPPLGAPTRQQVVLHPEGTLHPSPTHSCSPSTGPRLIKRKVLRKHEGQSLICDESFYSEDSDVANGLEEGLAELQVSPSNQFEPEDDDISAESHAHSSASSSSSLEERTSLSAFHSYMTESSSVCDLRPKPSKSFIRPVMNQHLKKTDPVTKYFQYKRFWETFKVPGERDRRELRWEIKERLAYDPPTVKHGRVPVPNSYVVPTEKKRSALRWAVRNHLANEHIPYKRHPPC